MSVEKPKSTKLDKRAKFPEDKADAAEATGREVKPAGMNLNGVHRPHRPTVAELKSEAVSGVRAKIQGLSLSEKWDDVEIDPKVRNMVREMAGMGMENYEIRSLVREYLNVVMTMEDFTYVFKDDILKGQAAANFEVAKSLFKRAVDPDAPGSTQAAIWWTKARMRWKEASVVEVTQDDKTIQRIERVIIDPKELPDGTEE